MALLASVWGAFVAVLLDPFYFIGAMGAVALGLNREPIYWAIALSIVIFCLTGNYASLTIVLVWAAAIAARRAM